MLQPKHLILPVLLALLLSGCVYKQDIRQGNQFDEESIAQIEPGETTRNQVRFLLGTPIIADPFHANRWDYVYFYKSGKTGKTQQRRYEIYFSDDVVERIVEVEP
ncbi:MAG: outer membrane protein assembly factor BamE [Gammaproteobacteria bacterium]|nr:outer membrane protein assembly factor BamE [Gammaproteobacteria bacterium]NND61122.1 outer membrane protein assembly factor BamE [Gammaproteobacteria bacterium]